MPSCGPGPAAGGRGCPQRAAAQAGRRPRWPHPKGLRVAGEDNHGHSFRHAYHQRLACKVGVAWSLEAAVDDDAALWAGGGTAAALSTQPACTGHNAGPPPSPAPHPTARAGPPHAWHDRPLPAAAKVGGRSARADTAGTWSTQAFLSTAPHRFILSASSSGATQLSAWIWSCTAATPGRLRPSVPPMPHRCGDL